MARDERDDYLDPPERGDRSPIRRSIDEATNRMFELIEEAARAAANIRARTPDDERGEDDRRRARRSDYAGRDEPDRDEDVERLALDRVSAISKLADSLVEYADQVRYESERLLGSLGEKVREAGGSSRTHRSRPRDRDRDWERDRDRAVTRDRDVEDRGRYTTYEDDEPDYEPPPRRRRSRSRRRDALPDEALLKATQMAVAGSTRGAIERFLVEEYGVEDPDPVLDSVLGVDR